jgi:hypothetical protein
MKGPPKLDLSSRGLADRPDPVQPQLVRDTSEDRAEPGHRIQGKEASDIEWATYCALRSLGWKADDIGFQVPIFGGRALIGGGQVLDFVITQGPVAVVIDVRGRRWHGAEVGKSARDREREIRLMADKKQQRLVIVWEDVAHRWDRLRELLLEEVGTK